jgi:hypothetical protein
VLPFKKSFFNSAVQSSSPVVSICINYLEIDDQPICVKNRDRIFYYGDQVFWPQLRHAFEMHSVRVEVIALAPIPTQAGQTNRDLLTQSAYQAVFTHFRPVGV